MNESMCQCCGPEIRSLLRHIVHQNEEILAAVVVDPAKLAELTARLNAKTAAVNAAVASNPVPKS